MATSRENVTLRPYGSEKDELKVVKEEKIYEYSAARLRYENTKNAIFSRQVASWVGAFALVSITLVSLGIFAFSQDQQKSQEAVRFLTIIIGAAAGTIFTYHLGKSN